ncbi:MAG TPA: helix-turn-helix transcriptional regulator [Thermoanaerobaculia bacterium]
MAMFTNLGHTLGLLRELRGKSQARVAREAGIGKSQLSKYENGKELPKLDSLEKVLIALKVSYFEFFYTLHLVDRRASELEPVENGDGAEEPHAQAESPLHMPSFLPGNTLLDDTTDQAFSQVFTDLLLLYRRIFQQRVLPSSGPGPAGQSADDLSAPG